MAQEVVSNRSWESGSFNLNQAAESLRQSGWSIVKSGSDRFVADRGSRWKLRLLGVLSKSVRENMPVRLVVLDDGAHIIAKALPNPGWYLFSFDMSDLYAGSAEIGLDELERLAQIDC